MKSRSVKIVDTNVSKSSETCQLNTTVQDFMLHKDLERIVLKTFFHLQKNLSSKYLVLCNSINIMIHILRI